MRAFTQRERLAFSMGYRVTDSGQILNPTGKQIVGVIHNGYLRFRVGIHGMCAAHRLAAFQTFGESIYQAGIVVRHKDANRANCSPSNLCLGTASENQMDKPREVRMRCAVNAARQNQKHDHAEVIRIYRETRSYKKTMAATGITSKGTINFIVRSSMVAQQVAA